MQKNFFVLLQKIVEEQECERVKKLKTEETNIAVDGVIEAQEEEDMQVHVPQPIPFVPYAFQTSNSRTAVRSFPVLKNLHQFLVNETEIVSILNFFKVNR